MKRSRKIRDVSLIEDECLACLAFFAYRTERTTRSELVEAMSTRLDEPTKGSREGWRKFKFDNIHFAFKKMEGTDVQGDLMSKTKNEALKAAKACRRGTEIIYVTT